MGVGPGGDGIDGRSKKVSRRLLDSRAGRQRDAQEGQRTTCDQGPRRRPSSINPVSKHLLCKSALGATLIFGARQAVDQLRDLFGDLILEDQDCFKGEAGWKDLLQLIPDSKIVEKLEHKWARSEGRSSEDKWDDLKAEIKALYKTAKDRVSLFHSWLPLTKLKRLGIAATNEAGIGRHNPSAYISAD